MKKSDKQSLTFKQLKNLVRESTGNFINWQYPEEPGNSMDNTETVGNVISELSTYTRSMLDHTDKDKLVKKLMMILTQANEVYNEWLDAASKDDL